MTTFAPVDPAVVDLLIRALEKIGVKRRLLGHLSVEQRRALKAGRSPVIKKDSRAAQVILAQLIPVLDEARNQQRADRFRGALRAALGEYAWRRATVAERRETGHPDELITLVGRSGESP